MRFSFLAVATILLLGGSTAVAAPWDRGATTPPKLTISAPETGETVRTPFAVHYAVTGFRVGRAPLGHVRLYVDRIGGFRIDLTTLRQTGQAVVSAHPLLSGKRTLIFVLTRADGTLVLNAKARVVVPDVVIVGGKGR